MACWIWTAAVSRRYGTFGVGGGRMVRAHRFAYEAIVGSIPEGLCVLHRCDVPRCVNPLHLFIGTHADNARDRDAKGRQSRGSTHYARTRPEALARGLRNGKAKLADDHVRAIRGMRDRASAAAIGRRFGVSATHVRRILSGEARAEAGAA